MPHIHEKIDFTTSALIVYQNTVLLRKHDKYRFWLSVGGHIEPDEDPTQAVVREVREEVGLSITLWNKSPLFSHEKDAQQELLPPRFMNRHHVNETHEHIDLVYIATTTSNVTTEMETEKSLGLHWFTKEELLDPTLDILEKMRHYALTALQEVSDSESHKQNSEE